MSMSKFNSRCTDDIFIPLFCQICVDGILEENCKMDRIFLVLFLQINTRSVNKFRYRSTDDKLELLFCQICVDGTLEANCDLIAW